MRFLGSRAEPEPDEIAAARVAVARKQWTEITPAERLVARPLGLLVDAETDRCYRRSHGQVFVSGSASLVSGDKAPLAFYVDRNGWPVLLEPVGDETWSTIVERRAGARR